jgi:hypothetical protein
MFKQRYNYEYLQQFCQENIIELECDYSKDKITRDTIIIGKCKSEGCDKVFEKNFRLLILINGYCNNCSIVIGKEKKKKTCLKKFGNEYSLQNKEVREKGKNTINKKYGVEYISQVPEIRNKVENTMMNRFGVLHVFQNEDIKNKIKETNLEKYGCEYVTQNEDIKNKTKKTNLEKYGCEYYLQTFDKSIKSKKTCLEKYGCEYPSQNIEIMDKCSKNAYKLKNYILPSGNILKIQGYENYALDEILQNSILEEDIINGCLNVPEIWYEDEIQKKHRHYVDIFIPSQHKMIEVKSTWTAEKKKDNIFLKQKACKNLGYLYEIWVYNNKGEKVKCYV